MRTRNLILSGTLLLASPGLAMAQPPQAAPPSQTPAAPQAGQPAADTTGTPRTGSFDFGFRGTTVDGDEARYNRLRDLRTGPFLSGFRYRRDGTDWLFGFNAENVGYRDQRIGASYERIGRLEAAFEWDQIPLFLANDQPTLFRETAEGVMNVDDSVQQNIQAATAGGPAARDAAIRAAIAGAGVDDLRSRRDTATLGLSFRVNRETDVHFNLKNSRRSGSQVFAFGFGTNPGLFPAVEFGAPLDDRTTDISGRVEYATARTLLALGYDGSWFSNDRPFIRFDNPMRAVDIAGGASQGQAAWWPGNSAFSVNATAGYSFARRTRATAMFSIGRWNQDEQLPPMTVNSALPAGNLPRPTADTQANITSFVLNLNSRPTNAIALNGQYRLYDYDNRTPHFEIDNAIIGDWAVTTQHHENEPSSFRRNTVDLEASYSPLDHLTLGLGYNREAGERSFRIFENTAENGFRITADSTGHRFFAIRTRYEFSDREGSGFEGHLLEEVGEQPGMRHFDIANRKRARALAMVSVFPIDWLTLNGSFSYGDDDYDDTGFGLRDNRNHAYGVGFDVTPMEMVSFGLNWGREEYKAHQYSRTANPLPSPTFDDPTRDWWVDQDDTTNTLTANVDLIKALPRTDIRLDYDLSDGKATYVYGLRPEQTVFTAAAPLQQLRPVKNKLNALRADVQHFLRSNLAVGLAYWYESYRAEDFAMDEVTLDSLVPASAASNLIANTFYAGYFIRPYTAHTTWLRLSYLW